MTFTFNGAFSMHNSILKTNCVLRFCFKENLYILHLARHNAKNFFKTNVQQWIRLKYPGKTQTGVKHYDVIN